VEMAEQSESKCPSSFSSLNLSNLEKQLAASSFGIEEAARKKEKYDKCIEGLEEKVKSGDTPTFNDAQKVTEARILMGENYFFTKEDDDWRLSEPPEGFIGTISEQTGNRNRITITHSGNKRIEKQAVVHSKGQQFTTVRSIAIIYKFNSDKLNIDSISNQDIKNFVNTLKKKSEKTKDFTKYYFDNYVVKFLKSNVTFIVVDNHLHLEV